MTQKLAVLVIHGLGKQHGYTNCDQACVVGHCLR